MISNSEYKNIDYALIYSTANEILATTSVIETFPYKVGKLVEEQSDIRLCKYSKAFGKYGVSIDKFGSESAVIQEYMGMYIISYNQDELDYRVRFSIMHEYGHYILKHKMNLSKDDPLYIRQELEANCFAAQMLMPEQLLRKANSNGKIISIDFIMNSFVVSDDAAEKRKKTLASTTPEWRSRAEKMYDDIILMRFEKFINKIAPINNKYYDYDYEMDRQYERNSWLDTRTRWN